MIRHSAPVLSGVVRQEPVLAGQAPHQVRLHPSAFIGHGMVIAGVLLVCTLAECCKKVYILLGTN